jgi:aerobic-type carbon monoxide dehydrogenase small subunit (CoxS/CutS family)
MTETIQFNLNGRPTRLDVDGERKLLWVLRGELGLTGTKFGCGESQCGSCTVVVDGEAVRSCRVAMRDIRGKDVTTIEGLERGGKLHPVQEAFVEHGGMQCGFCTPGMVMSAYALLRKHPNPTRAQVVEALDENLCRCANYKRILEAVQSAAAAK